MPASHSPLFEPLGKAQIAIVDDDPDIQVFLRELFKREGYNVDLFSTGREGLDALAKNGHRWDLLICDLKLPDVDGLDLIETVQEMGIAIPIILITANATVETAAAALKRGAFDYISKPINPVELSVISARAIQLNRLERDYDALQKQVERVWKVGGLIGKSAKMRKILDLVSRVADSSASVLITGESGTGKEVVARAIHSKSPRAKAPFVAINCSAIPDHLLESELFGHRRGAFTGASENRKGLFEEAQGGTVFLDEIGDMPMPLQAKLLRVLQERKVKPVGANEMKSIDVRIVAATHKDLRRAIVDGAFREDLFFRLCVVPVGLPALRERTEDIPILVDHFLAKYSEQNGVRLKRLTKPALAKLMRMGWPGNVRELENCIERAVVLSEEDFIDENEIRAEGMPDADSKVREFFAKLPTLEELEREYIAYVLAETGDHKEKAAELLGINRKTLYRKERDTSI